ncbi:hypothetical protein F2Q68_00010341 [Brassica cretica]|uniref:Retrotransposon gag domain-containing protein n=1 Tax=Brassica cretica TaxID=69181 RepID=A0A8S9L0D5_BRACR|nr:hypothetical protein F2Q68_00010341 [Brassica cretica]
MLAVPLSKVSRKATTCKGLGSTLTRPALQWYINLPSRSIASFVVLSDKFVEQFASSRDLEKTSDSLYEVLQHRAEPLRGYIARFNQEKVPIPECNLWRIPVDSILILLFLVESPGTQKIESSSAEFWPSVDRCWDINVDRWLSWMASPLFEAFVYATSCVIEFFCSLLLVFWNVALMYEQVVCSISCLKDVCDVLSRYVQCTSVYFSCVAIWVPENTKFVWS